MALNNFVVDAIAGARGQTTSAFIGDIQNARAGNSLAVLQEQLKKIKSADALNDSQRAEKNRLTSEKKNSEKKSEALSTLNEQLGKLGQFAEQFNGLKGIRAEETKNVKVQKEIKSQKTVENLGNPLGITKANLSDEKLTLGNADVLFGSQAVDAQAQVQIKVAAGATNIEGLPTGTVTARRVGNSDHIQLLDSNGQVINIGGSGNGSVNSISGISVAKVTTSTEETTTIQETIEQQKAANFAKIKEAFSAFNDQINTVKSFLTENTKEGGTLQNDAGAKQVLTQLNNATRQLNGVDADKFVQGSAKSFAQFEGIGRTTAQSVSNIATRFAGPGSVLGQETSSLQAQTKLINKQLDSLAQTEEENRKQLQEAAGNIAASALAIGNQKSFLQKVGNEPGATTGPKKAASPAFNIPKLPGTAPTSIGGATASVV